MNELNKINQAISMVDDKTHQFLNYAGNKTRLQSTKQSNLTNAKDQIRNDNFISPSHQHIANDADRKFKQMLAVMFL